MQNAAGIGQLVGIQAASEREAATDGEVDRVGRVARSSNRFDDLRLCQAFAIREYSPADGVACSGSCNLRRIMGAIALTSTHRAQRHPDRGLRTGPYCIVLLHEGDADQLKLMAGEMDGELICAPNKSCIGRDSQD